MSNIPIVFIHKGYQDYLKIALTQAKSFNKFAELILIGDESNARLNKICKHYNYEKYSQESYRFEKYFLHYSTTNTYEYEFFCVKRWFILLSFMKAQKLQWVFVADTDVLIYCSINSFFSKYIKGSGFNSAFCIPEQKHSKLRWVASGHTAFISIEFLSEFCNYVYDIYKFRFEILTPKIDYHKEKNIPGGITDMTFFYLYNHEISNNTLNLLSNLNGFIFNKNVGMGTTENEIGIDAIKWKRKLPDILNKPYTKNTKGDQIFYGTLHMHGGSKYFMEKFYSGYWFKETYKRKIVKVFNMINFRKKSKLS